MQASILFTCPLTIKGFQMPWVSSEMAYLLSIDGLQEGENGIIAQLGRLFELELEVLTEAVWTEAPEIVLTYDPFEEDWAYTGDKEDPAALKFMYELAQSVQTGGTDDEMLDFMEEEGWSSTELLQTGIHPLLEFIGKYPYFWRAIKYNGQEWLKPYFEQETTKLDGQMVSTFYLDIQELAHFANRATKKKLLWFAKIQSDNNANSSPLNA